MLSVNYININLHGIIHVYMVILTGYGSPVMVVFIKHVSFSTMVLIMVLNKDRLLALNVNNIEWFATLL